MHFIFFVVLVYEAEEPITTVARNFRRETWFVQKLMPRSIESVSRAYHALTVMVKFKNLIYFYPNFWSNSIMINSVLYIFDFQQIMIILCLSHPNVM